MPAPPISALEQIQKLDRSLVENVRSRFLAEANTQPNLYSPADVETVQKNSWQVERFILEAKLNGENALKTMKTAMQWRHEQSVHQMTASDFPAEYFQSGYIVRFGRDSAGATVIIFRANIHQKTSEWNDLLKRFFVYQIEQIDLCNDGKGVTMVIDCAGIGLSNLDLDLLKFIVTSFSQYYPKLFDAIIVHELPYLLTYVFKLVQSWLPEEDRKFFHLSTKKTLTNFISTSELPPFLGGSNASNWRMVPTGVVPALEFVQLKSLKVDSAEKLKFLNIYIK